MQAILDNLASIFVSSAVLLIFAYIQIHGTLSANEATINNMVYAEVININDLLERDLENMLTQAQTDLAIAAGVYTGGGGAYACSLLTANFRASEITFPTIEDPDSTMGAVDPLISQAVEVRYLLEVTGDSTAIRVGATEQLVPTFQLNRYVNGKSTGISRPILTEFLVQFGDKGSNIFMPTDTQAATTTQCNANIAKVRFDFKLAAEGIGFTSRDKRATSGTNISRFGSTISLSNFE